MKKTNKFLSVFLTLIMVVSIIPMSTITVSADAPTYVEYEDYIIILNETTMTCSIYQYLGTDESVVIPSNIDGYTVTGIGWGAFSGHTQLVDITLPDTITYIARGAFSSSGYYKDKNNWTDGVLYIGEYLISTDDDFVNDKYCVKEGTKLIAEYAFSSCVNLTSITIPESVTIIGDDAFRNCEKLEEINMSSNIMEMGDAFEDTAYYNTESNWENGILYIGNWLYSVDCSIVSGTVTVKDGTKYIKDYSFSDIYTGDSLADALVEVILPNSVTTIGDSAFAGCDGLTEIVLPDILTSIGDSAFKNCTSLTSVTIGDNVKLIGDNAFYGCTCLLEFIVDSNNQYYSSDECGVLFNKNKTTLIKYPIANVRTNYTIPYSVISISSMAFENCTSLISIEIPDSVISIGSTTFRGCTGLQSVTIGDSVTSIGDNAFENCTSLISIEIPDSVISIGSMTFRGCTGLQSVTIGDSVTSIGYGAFKNCTSLTSVTIGDSVTSIGDYAFENCTSLINITIPGSVTSIGYGVFEGCTGLQRIIIPYGVKSINSAFNGCTNLESITIPDTVTSISSWTFYNCTSLADVYYFGTEEQWNAIEIEELYNSNEKLLNATIHYNYIPPFTGIKDNHFYKDDVMQKAYQLVEFDGDFYYIGDRHEIVKDKKVYIKEERLNGLTYEDGSPITAGYYEFDEDGKMVILNGVVGNKIYKNNTQLKAYQLVEVDGDIYYIGDRHEIIKGRKAYVKEDRINGLTYADGTPITAGYYDFDENGKMVIVNGVVGDHIYKNNTMLKAYQLVEVDGEFYYIGDRHEIIKDRKAYVKEDRINGLTYADGTPITAGYYDFDENGKMVIVNGVVGDHIYKNNTMLKAYQLVEVDGEFYYIVDRHEIIKGRKAYVKEDRINGLTYEDGTPITAGYYDFDEDGKMIIK